MHFNTKIVDFTSIAAPFKAVLLNASSVFWRGEVVKLFPRAKLDITQKNNVGSLFKRMCEEEIVIELFVN